MYVFSGCASTSLPVSFVRHLSLGIPIFLLAMYFSTLLLLPLLAAADTQEWLDRASGWFDKAKSFAPQQAFPDILDAGAAQVSAQEVQKISVQNWERKLSQKDAGPEGWLIFVTGNKSCHGNCQHIETEWNVRLEASDSRILS